IGAVHCGPFSAVAARCIVGHPGSSELPHSPPAPRSVKMAAPAAAVSASLPDSCPNFAVVCSFLERYGPALDLPELTFPQIERYLRDTTTASQPLVELHVKLMRKIGKSVSADRWEKYLIKMCQELNATWAWELEKKGYVELSVESKAGILKYLCECQFDDNFKFKTAVNEEDPDKMRMQPIGRDKDGLVTRDDLAEILELLKAQIDPALLNKKETPGGSTSASPSPEDEDSKKEGAQGQSGDVRKAKNSEDVSEDEGGSSAKDSSLCASSKTSGEEEPSSEKEGKRGLMQEVKWISVQKTEEKGVDLQKTKDQPLVDNRVRTITAIVKEESKDPEIVTTLTQSRTSVIERVEGPAKLETKEAAREKTPEEVERAMKNDQQAKIPLKKRELKLREDFDSGGGIIIRNPSITPTKELVKEEVGRCEDAMKAPPKPIGTIEKGVRGILLNGKMMPTKEVVDTGGIKEQFMSGKSTRVDTAEGDTSARSENGEVGDTAKARSSAVKEKCLGQEKNKLPEPGSKVSTAEGKENASAGTVTAAVDRTMSRITSAEVQKCPEPQDAAQPGLKEEQEKLPKQVFKEKTVKQDPEDKRAAFGESEEDRYNAQEGSTTESCPTETETPERKVKMADSTYEKPLDQKVSTEAQREGKVRKCASAVKELTERQNGGPKVEDKLERKENIPQEEREGQEDEKEKSTAVGEATSGKGAPEQNIQGSAEHQEPDPVAKEIKEDDVSSEIQKEGIRLKIKIPANRRKVSIQLEEKRLGSESDTTDGRSLRRSPRICRPTAKLAEIQDMKQEKKQASSVVREEGEDAEGLGFGAEGRQVERDNGQLTVLVFQGQRQSGRSRWSGARAKQCRTKGSSEEDEEQSEEDDSDEDYVMEKDRLGNDFASGSDESPNDDPCKHCGLPNHPELKFLCEKLEEQLQNLDVALKKRERAERRRERLVYVGISVENIIPPPEAEAEEEKQVKKKDAKKSRNQGRRSTRAKKCISYRCVAPLGSVLLTGALLRTMLGFTVFPPGRRFDDFDEAIDEAIEEDIKEAEGGGAGRGKDMANITGHRGKDMSTIMHEEGKENRRPARKVAAQHRRKRRRLNDLDSDSSGDDDESEEEFRLSTSSEEEEFVGESDEEAQYRSDSDFSSTGRRPKVWASSSEEEEEVDDEMVTEGSSELSDGDLDLRRRRSRRSRKSQVNYRETSDSEASQVSRNRDRPKVHRRWLSSSESEGALRSRHSDDDDNDEEEEDEQGGRSRTKTKGESKRSWSDKELWRRRRRLAQKRRRASEDDEDESEESEEEERPVRKRLNRIETDEEDEDEEKEPQENKKNTGEEGDSSAKRPRRTATGGGALGHRPGAAPPTNGQAAARPKNSGAPNGVGRQEVPSHEEDEDDLLGVTDLVDYVCNSEQL
ncbi:remodeling and spacing factor 1-like, partial [Scleropages formosus]